MSSVPIPTTSHEATSSDHVQRPSANGDSGDATDSKAAESNSGDAVHVAGQQGGKRIKQASRSHRPATTARPKSSAANYRELLNTVIKDAVGGYDDDLDVLPPSQIGASYWTSTEKECLFATVARCSPGDLPTLSRAIGSKSEAEVNVYLKLLQDGVYEASAASSSKDAFSSADLPAAYEISTACEVALDDAADALARKIEKNDVRLEEGRHGDGWLIDEDLASAIEAGMESSKSSEDATTADDYPASKAERADPPPFPSAGLLRPEAFLQLSRNLFMNARPESGNNWRDLVDEGNSTSSPAIFRTAFDDFYNLTVSFTRRLLQTTLFQATSRLRARDTSRNNWQPAAEVKEVDVRTAAELLSLRTKWRTYWAEVPRRCGVEVYTDIGTYIDGRPGTKNGVKLTSEEVEAELGMNPEKHEAGETEQAPSDGKGELHESDFESDDFTDLSDDDQTLGHEKQQYAVDEAFKTEDGDPGGSIKNETRSTRKRKRELSPTLVKLEDQYVEAFDMSAGVAETCRLWKSLGRDRDEPKFEVLPKLPSLPRAKHTDSDVRGNWRAKVMDEAMWERFGEAVPEHEFHGMEKLGGVGREKRRRLREDMLTRVHNLEPTLSGTKVESDISADDGSVTALDSDAESEDSVDEVDSDDG
ncbi:hypothetical protein B0A55_09943 [Friedmanniomyces simplex]|uniref:Myb-like domain-containing protein n=1 Tax=Friedmanniomyces simplex TaxID=329884 RepID=A0A4V5NEX5_9PEZI|nr:hypothetical protein B0A55_09943 [Friedmanniomyces simplex]